MEKPSVRRASSSPERRQTSAACMVRCAASALARSSRSAAIGHRAGRCGSIPSTGVASVFSPEATSGTRPGSVSTLGRSMSRTLSFLAPELNLRAGPATERSLGWHAPPVRTTELNASLSLAGPTTTCGPRGQVRSRGPPKHLGRPGCLRFCANFDNTGSVYCDMREPRRNNLCPSAWALIFLRLECDSP
jgi:hypothetical protein